MVAPIGIEKNKAKSDRRKDKGKLWDSGDEETSSEEDFNFIG